MPEFLSLNYIRATTHGRSTQEKTIHKDELLSQDTTTLEKFYISLRCA